MRYFSAGRGRWILAIGAVLVVGSCFLQWWQIGGDAGQLTRQAATGFSSTTGTVFPMFLTAIATLLLLTLPFASDKPVAVDHPLSYLVLLAAGGVCYVLSAVALAQQGLMPFPPQLGLGFWVAAIGLLVMARGVFEFYEEYRRRLY